MNFKRFLGTYWPIGLVLVLGAIALLMFKPGQQAAPTAATGAPIAPPSLSPSQLGLEEGGLSDQISNLAAQISAGFQNVGSNVPPSQTSPGPVPPSVSGTDTGPPPVFTPPTSPVFANGPGLRPIDIGKFWGGS